MVLHAPVAEYFAEFVGTFIVVFTFGCNKLTGQSSWGALSTGCALTVMIYALGKSSGGHFNPAVSLAFGITGNLPWVDVVAYIGMQLVGGILAGLAYVALFWHFWDSFDLAPALGHTWWEAALAEMLYTFMLCFVALNAAASGPHAGRHRFHGVAVGAAYVAGAYGGGALSLGCFNPALAVGIDLSSTREGISYCLLYAMFEFAGGFMAAIFFWLVRPDEADKVGSRLPLGGADGYSKQPRYSLISRHLAEFVGTYMIALTFGLSVLAASASAPGIPAAAAAAAVAAPAVALAVAAALASMTFALASVSGAHFNPAVTVAVCASGREAIRPSVAVGYVLVQVLAGFLGSLTCRGMMDGRTFALKPEDSLWARVIVAEFIFTFVLAFVVLSVLTSKSGISEYFGLAAGMCVAVGGVAAGKISRGSLNPAVSIGVEGAHVFDGGVFWPCLIYLAAQLAAGLVAACVFCGTQPSEYDSDSEEEAIVDDGVLFLQG